MAGTNLFLNEESSAIHQSFAVYFDSSLYPERAEADMYSRDYRATNRQLMEEQALHMGVESRESVEVFDNAMYNLQGQRILAPAKGQIYILHGRKMFAR